MKREKRKGGGADRPGGRKGRIGREEAKGAENTDYQIPSLITVIDALGTFLINFQPTSVRYGSYVDLLEVE